MVDPVQEIKSKLGIVELVSDYVQLKKAGAYFKGLSPFTSEKTPSFYVSPQKDIAFCFSTWVFFYLEFIVARHSNTALPLPMPRLNISKPNPCRLLLRWAWSALL